MGDYLELIVFLVLLVIGYVAGRVAEQRHYRSIRSREKTNADIHVFSNRFPPLTRQAQQALVSGSVVVSEDYFKRFVASLRKIVGGRLASYESLLDRARREAVLRMKEEARRHGASIIVNVKFSTSSISGNNPNGMGTVELLAYGTALKFD